MRREAFVALAKLLDLSGYVERARGHDHAAGHPAKTRTVVRLDPATVRRLAHLRSTRFPEASRATLVRALVALGLEVADAQAPAEERAP